MAGVWDADVIVAGSGAWGSMAAWRLAAAGLDVLVLDRYAPPHAEGSSHGSTRLFRVANLEHPSLTELARLSMTLYRELETPEVELLHLSGGLTMGPEDGIAVTGALKAAATGGASVELLDRRQLEDRFPFHTGLTAADVGVLDPGAGVLMIEAAVQRAVESAVAAGARLQTGVRVTDVLAIPGGVRVTSSAGVFRAPKVVLAVGSWTRQLFPDLPLKTTRMPMSWFGSVPGQEQLNSLATTGAFIREIGVGGGYWGHAALPGQDAKVGPRGAVARRDDPLPDQLDRRYTVYDSEPASAVVRDYLPSLVPSPSEGFVCHSTRTPDEQFLVGAVPGVPGLVLACGESGHGGKHSAGVGQLVADLVLEQDPRFDLDFLSPSRYLHP
jgi:sarcosine oxidase